MSRFFLLPLLALVCPFILAAPVELVDEKPVKISKTEGGYLVDFGKVSFGNLRLTKPAGKKNQEITIHFGEDFDGEKINRKPPGSVRYARAELLLKGKKPLIGEPSPDRRNTQQNRKNTPPAILTPYDWGTLIPFRWVEIENWPGELTAAHITRKSAFLEAWDDDDADFSCSDDTLNKIWDLCHYSIKATTFAGVYVDGDRERIPYEADAYLNQLSHYYTDGDKQIARDTIDHLLKHGTWPTEWAPHMVFMAHADWLFTGDTEWVSKRYETLKGKMLTDRVADDHLVASGPKDIKRTDIVDWPRKERDGYQFTKRNTVVNSFRLETLKMMADLAEALGKTSEAAQFRAEYDKAFPVFQMAFFDKKAGIYRDGVGTKHSAQHANFFPLAFDLVPEDRIPKVVDFIKGKNMACSVYAAQYLLEALFENGEAQHALDLILAPGDRSWRHMLESGTTITWEAWDQKYKPNQDWNHAWGAAPANLLPRYVLGAEPLTAGWKETLLKPNPADLTMAKGKVPTHQGPIEIHWTNGESFKMTVTLPSGIAGRVSLPDNGASEGVYLNGQLTETTRHKGRWVLAKTVTGSVELEVR